MAKAAYNSIDMYKNKNGRSMRSVVIFFLSHQWLNAKPGDVIREYRSTFRYSFYKEFGGSGLVRGVNVADVKHFAKIEILPIDSPLMIVEKTLDDDMLLRNTFEGCTRHEFMQFLEKIYGRGKSWKGIKTSLMIINWKVLDINREKFNYLVNNYLTGEEAFRYFMTARYERRTKEYGSALKPGAISYVEWKKSGEWMR